MSGTSHTWRFQIAGYSILSSKTFNNPITITTQTCSFVNRSLTKSLDLSLFPWSLTYIHKHIFSKRSIAQWKKQDQPSRKLITTYHFQAFFPSTQDNILNALSTHPIIQHQPRYLLIFQSMPHCSHVVPMLHNLHHFPPFKNKTMNIIQILNN